MKEFLNARTGFALVVAITVFSALWLGTYGRAALRPAKPAASTEESDLRFREDAWFLPSDPLVGFVAIPAGAFLMGSDPTIDSHAFENERWSRERFQGVVDLPDFYIARFEVTVAQFRAFVAATGRVVDAAALSGESNHPVTHVTWPEALAYARWLEKNLLASDVAPRIAELLRNGWRIALPTEAQWEKAARGSDGRIYPWGNSPHRDYANYGSANTVAVGSRACIGCANDLADMSGNVFELTRSPYRAYPYTEQPIDVSEDALFVMRGGSFNDNEHGVRAALRGGIDPGARRSFVGFRVVVTRDYNRTD